ncbi:MAG TPA: NAD(P)/FAD-dependent oxidoreductase [Clostridiaceae bacterium]|nr:NAD(P)/FAD-dependent oxidoreductase [Clostridiaceae bacterium]
MQERFRCRRRELKKYDVLVIGAGLAGIFAGYELIKERPNLKVAILERGTAIRNRSCPIVAGKTPRCINCSTCDIMRGFGGAGAFSDGKFNFTTQFGGWLNEYISDRSVMDLIEYVDEVNQSFGATDEFFSTYGEAADLIRQRALGADLHLLDARCKHLGTERNKEILIAQYDWLVEHLDMLCHHKVENIARGDGGGWILETNQGDFSAPYLVAAPGRSGAEWFSEQCRELGVPLLNNQVDLGVRVELPAAVFKQVTDAVYEAKIKYRTRCHGDIVRTFCMNPYGHVVTENTDGIITVNGHSYTDPTLQSDNTNFALLVSNTFTEPFNEPYRYGKHIAALSNMLGGGVMVQRLGDLFDGRRTTEHRLARSFVRPTLEATPGDLSLVLPKRHLDNIIEMISALDKLTPGIANSDTLLYGVEVKFYSSRITLSHELETPLKNFFAAGDGAGVTRGLSQAGASGVYVARNIIRRMNGNTAH